MKLPSDEKFEKALSRLDKISVMLRKHFDPSDQEIDAILNEILRLRFMLQKLKSSPKGGAKNNTNYEPLPIRW